MKLLAIVVVSSAFSWAKALGILPLCLCNLPPKTTSACLGDPLSHKAQRLAPRRMGMHRRVPGTTSIGLKLSSSPILNIFGVDNIEESTIRHNFGTTEQFRTIKTVLKQTC
eukprot:1715245-Amphidinium_carterae.2